MMWYADVLSLSLSLSLWFSHGAVLKSLSVEQMTFFYSIVEAQGVCMHYIMMMS